MELPETKRLREYLIEGEQEVNAEEEKINTIVEQETKAFFSNYQNGEWDKSIEQEFREAIRNIYDRKIKKKRAALDAINKKILRIENEYLGQCCA